MGKSRSYFILLSTTALSGLLSVQHAAAVCTPATGTAGDDSITCVTGAPDTALLDLTQGGNDRVTVNDGNVGPVNFGIGDDRMEVRGGIVGAVTQSNGVDLFIMTGGTVDSLNQGSGIDTATISGGRIIGLFYAGDIFTMTGGRIGEVDLEQANNQMRMSGGVIDTNVSAAQGADLLELSGGVIGGNVDLGNGNNTMTVTGGSIGGTVTTGNGIDRFTWDRAGTIGGVVSLGSGNDFGTIRNLTDTILGTAPQIDGGTGVDQLTFDNTITTGFARYINWENVALTNGTQFTLNGNMVLGDAGSLTGTLSIDVSSTLLAGNGANAMVQSFGGPSVTVTNAGTIDLTNGGNTAANTLTIAGNYFGAGGFLNLRTVLASDGAASDKLVIAGAGNSASGTTSIGIANAGGAGAVTRADGIIVVEAVGGATTAPGSFALAGPVAAGIYEYQLFKGGVAGGTPDNWYLRSSEIVSPGTSLPDQLPPGSTELADGSIAIALIRPEVAVHSMVPAIVRSLGLATLGTYQERVGLENQLAGVERKRDGWGRVFGQQTREHFKGDVRPDFDGSFAGVQAGHDLWRSESPSGHRNDIGVYLAHAEARGDARGIALGLNVIDVGKVDLSATSLGAYWTHIGPSGWYIDTVVQGSMIAGSPHSTRRIGASVSGQSFAASIEGGLPIPLGAGVILEPQAQAVWLHTSLDDTLDRLSTISYGDSNTLSGRVGARLQAGFSGAGMTWLPYIKANLRWGADGTDTVMFATDAIATRRNSGTIGEIGGGITARLTDVVTVYADGSYLAGLSGEDRTTIKGNLGLRMIW